MKILITGAGGMLGTDLSQVLASEHSVCGVGTHLAPHLEIPYSLIDLSEAAPVHELFSASKPDLILHCAARTDVDGCESDRQRALKDNVIATQNVIDAANRISAFVVLFSTDYVFKGTLAGEYSEEAETGPVNFYGETKRLAEIYTQEKSNNYVIIRLSWLYGMHGKSFPRTLLQSANRQSGFAIVNDQRGRPTSTRDLAMEIGNFLRRNPEGFSRWNRQIFHFANEGIATWLEFARYILDQAGYSSVQTTPQTSKKLNRPAQRPENSVLGLDKAKQQLGIEFRHWKVAFLDFLKKYQQHPSTEGAS